MIQILRLAARSIARARGATLLAMCTLAIGLGSAVALMGMLDAGVRPLPVPDGSRVVELELRNSRAEKVEAPAPIQEWAAGSGLEGAGALHQFPASLVPADRGAMRLTGAAMHPSVLRLLRVQPAFGRLPSDDPADADALVVGWSVWEELGADPALLGSAVRVDGVTHTLVGVMPEGFGFPERQSFWTVLPPDQSGEIVARLAGGVSTDAAVDAVEARMNAALTAHDDGPFTVAAAPWTKSRDGGGEGALFIGLAILVALLLVVCAANVSTLLLVRGEERAGSLAVHAALGASRLRIAGQLFAEAALIAVGGGVIGLMSGFALLRWMQVNLSEHWGYYWMTMEVRLPVVLGTAAVVLVVSVLAGTAPAMQAMRVDVARMLVSAGQGRHDRRRRALGRWFVSAQVALSTLGLLVATYLAWGVGELGRVTERLPMDELAVASITIPADRYVTAIEREALADELRRRLGLLPGVTSVSVGTALPGGPGGGARLELPGDQDESDARRHVTWAAFDDGLAATYDMRLVAGRLFRVGDRAGNSPVALVTAGTAARLFEGDAVGRQIRLDGVHGEGEWANVVGVIENWMPEDESDATGRIILPLAQVSTDRLTLAIRTADPRGVLDGVRTAVAEIDRELPLDELQTLDARMDWFLRMWRVIAAFGVFGGVASALVAAVGLFGVVSFQVRSRTKEIGLRMAVGAGSRRVALLFVGETMRRVLPGLVAGFTLSLFVMPMLSRFVAGSRGSPDTLLMAVVVAGMLAIGVAAALEPALRAARLDPQTALRSD